MFDTRITPPYRYFKIWIHSYTCALIPISSPILIPTIELHFWVVLNTSLLFYPLNDFFRIPLYFLMNDQPRKRWHFFFDLKFLTNTIFIKPCLLSVFILLVDFTVFLLLLKFQQGSFCVFLQNQFRSVGKNTKE